MLVFNNSCRSRRLQQPGRLVGRVPHRQGGVDKAQTCAVWLRLNCRRRRREQFVSYGAAVTRSSMKRFCWHRVRPASGRSPSGFASPPDKQTAATNFWRCAPRKAETAPRRFSGQVAASARSIRWTSTATRTAVPSVLRWSSTEAGLPEVPEAPGAPVDAGHCTASAQQAHVAVALQRLASGIEAAVPTADPSRRPTDRCLTAGPRSGRGWAQYGSARWRRSSAGRC